MDDHAISALTMLHQDMEEDEVRTNKVQILVTAALCCIFFFTFLLWTPP